MNDKKNRNHVRVIITLILSISGTCAINSATTTLETTKVPVKKGKPTVVNTKQPTPKANTKINVKTTTTQKTAKLAPKKPKPTSQDLFDAIDKQDVKRVIQLINDGVDIHTPSSDKDQRGLRNLTPLQYVAISEIDDANSTMIAKILLSKGAVIEPDITYRDSALIIALMWGKPIMATELINSGANVNVTSSDHYYETPLMLAMSSSSDRQVIEKLTKLLLQKGASKTINNHETYEQATALVLAYPTVNIISMLLDAGADANFALQRSTFINRTDMLTDETTKKQILKLLQDSAKKARTVKTQTAIKKK